MQAVSIAIVLSCFMVLAFSKEENKSTLNPNGGRDFKVRKTLGSNRISNADRMEEFQEGPETLDFGEAKQRLAEIMKEQQEEQDLKKRYMRFGKRYMRFGRALDGEVYQDQEAQPSETIENDIGLDIPKEEDESKRGYMRFGKRGYMRFGK